MDNGDIESGAEENFRSPIGRKYRPVVDEDSAVLELSSMDPSGSSSSSSVPVVHQTPVKYVLLVHNSLISWCIWRFEKMCYGDGLGGVVVTESFCLFTEKFDRKRSEKTNNS